jgi:hypothetical protein
VLGIALLLSRCKSVGREWYEGITNGNIRRLRRGDGTILFTLRLLRPISSISATWISILSLVNLLNLTSNSWVSFQLQGMFYFLTRGFYHNPHIAENTFLRSSTP